MVCNPTANKKPSLRKEGIVELVYQVISVRKFVILVEFNAADPVLEIE
jgi:hypothetical protein